MIDCVEAHIRQNAMWPVRRQVLLRTNDCVWDDAVVYIWCNVESSNTTTVTKRPTWQQLEQAFKGEQHEQTI